MLFSKFFNKNNLLKERNTSFSSSIVISCELVSTEKLEYEKLYFLKDLNMPCKLVAYGGSKEISFLSIGNIRNLESISPNYLFPLLFGRLIIDETENSVATIMNVINTVSVVD